MIGTIAGMTMLHSPHDKLFKSAMKDLRVARDFFTHYLPASVLEAVDLNSLKLWPNSYVTPELTESFSDILYQVTLAQKPAFLYLLCEHQSSVDELMPLRLWQYMVGIWSDYLKQQKKKHADLKKKPTLPLIIPLVFYHGPHPYNGSRHLRDLIEAPSTLIEQLFEPFHLIDTHDLADEDLREQKWAGIMALVMKHIRLRDLGIILKTLVEMIHFLDSQPDSTVYLTNLLNYTIGEGDIPNPKVFLQTITEGLSAPKREGAMTIASRLIDEGREQGVKQVLLSLVECKFGSIPARYRVRIEQASNEQLMDWGTRLLKVNSLSALFEEAEQTVVF